MSFLLLLLVALPGHTHTPQDLPVDAARNYRLHRQGDTYTLRARDAKLIDILTEIQRLAGIRITAEPNLQARVTLDLQGATLEQLLNTLGGSRAFVYERSGEELSMVSATLAAEEQAAAPSRFELAGVPEKRSAEEQALLEARGVLTNSDRPLASLLRRGARTLLLQNALIDTELAARTGRSVDVPEAFRAGPDTQRYIVQFDHAVSREDRDLLESAGAAACHYVPNSAYAVHVPPGALDRVRSLDGVCHVEPYHPYYKLSHDLVDYFQRGDEADEGARNRVENGAFNLMTFRGAEAADLLKRQGVEVLKTQHAENRTTLTVKCPPGLLPELARSDAVQWLEPDAPFQRMNDLAGRTAGATAFRTGHAHLTGAGVTVAVTDSGLDFFHPGFSIDPSQPTTTGLNSRVVHYAVRAGLTSDGIPGDTDGHGTHVAGTILGNGALSDTAVSVPGSGNPPYRTNDFVGMAPMANLVVIEDFNSFSEQEQAETAYRNGARISNNSWGNTVFEYGTASAMWDAYVRDADEAEEGNQPLIVVFSAGNSGYGEDDGIGGYANTIGQPANAKNVISVGATEQARFANNFPWMPSVPSCDNDWQVAYYSSRGPVTDTDLRGKPDLLAPGTYVMSAQSHETNPDALTNAALPYWDYRYGNVDSGTNYALFSGTSMAAPVAAGAAALLFQYYTNIFEREPTPAMIKAALVNGAHPANRVTYGWPGYFFDGAYIYQPTLYYQGWGMIDVERAADGPDAFDSEDVLWLDTDETTPLVTGQSYTRNYSITVQGGSLKITLAWTDAPGTPGGGVQLVNDLDLIVVGPGGKGYVGNFYSTDRMHSYGMPGYDRSTFTNTFPWNYDRYNNVEQILIRDAAPGTYTIEVYGNEVPEGPQDFALAITKGVNSVEGHSAGDHVDLALGTNGAPIMVYSGPDEGGHRQVFVKRWIGPSGSQDEIGEWKRLEDRWFGFENSARDTGISQTLEDSIHPSVAVNGPNVYVAWEERPPTTNEVAHIYLKQWNGTNWVALGGSASGNGVSANGDYDATDPIVYVGPNGLPVVAWVKGILTGSFPSYQFYFRIWAARWNGSGWSSMGSSYITGIPNGQYAARPDMVVDTSNRVVVAWEEPTQARILVYRWSGSTWDNIGSLGSSPYAGFASLAAGPNASLYITWIQQPNTSGGQIYPSVFAARNTNGVWQAMGNSLTYPGVSAATNEPSTPYQSAITFSGSGRPMLIWQAGSNAAPNAVYIKYFSGTTWLGISESDRFPGIHRGGGLASWPAIIADSQGLPIGAYQTRVSDNDEVMAYRIITDEEPPSFEGLKTATGGTNNNVLLTWLPASDFSSTIYYHIFRSAGSFACGTTPTCTAADVFTNQIAVVANLTTFQVTNLVTDQVYCFGVRAEDTNGLMELNTVIRYAGPTDPTGDADNDCLVYSNEVSAGTEPCLKDTDGDGMWDGWEWTYSTNNPSHTNALFLDPLDNGVDNVRTLEGDDGNTVQLPGEDMDNDGVSNLEEFEWWYNVYLVSGCDAGSPTNRVGPDPTDADTDDDGIPDGWEIINELDPTDPLDALNDEEPDGLNNLQEYQLGTDPRSADSDSDGLSDGAEFVGGTNPALADSDGDGLDDGEDPSPTVAESLAQGVGDGDVYQLGYAGAVANIFSNLLYETFETNSLSRTNWTHYALAAFDLWHLSTADPAPKSNTILFLHERSTSVACRVANDPTSTNPAATYNMGPIFLRCCLESPRIDVRGVSNVFVAWNEFYETEAYKDLCTLQGRGGGDTNWYVLNNPSSGASSGWVHRVADATRYAGRTNFQVRFLFSADNKGNSLAGWYVDDVWVFSGTTITGWVRDVNGRPITGARVLALGRGGITNAIEGHRYVLPGTVFGEGTTLGDGSYRIAGLPRGRFYVKATDPNHRDEFYDGPLYSNFYGFARGKYAGVFNIGLVSARGWLDLRGLGAVTNCDFELEPGAGRDYLGVALANAAGTRFDVHLNGADTNLVTLIWNGSTSTPSFINYQTATGLTQVINYPDWITSNAPPVLLADVAPGTHLVYAGTNLAIYPPPDVTLREGEITLVNVFTNQGEGRLYITAKDGGNYPIWVNDHAMTNVTPAVIPVKAGGHRVMLLPTNGTFRIAPKFVTVPLGSRAVVEFSTNDLSGPFGGLKIETVNIFGGTVSGAVVILDGQPVTTNDVVLSGTCQTPTTLLELRPGAHTVTVRKDGYTFAQFRTVAVNSFVTNVVSFVLYQADRDYDGVGDETEISGYADLFLYDRDDDPDNDGLNNLFEFDQFRLYNVLMNTFNADTDGDGMPDGSELGYDGRTNVLAVSTLSTNALQGTSVVRAHFTGRFLEGLNNFGDGYVSAAIECDLFEANTIKVTNPVVPSVLSAETVFSGIPPAVTERSVSWTHNAGVEILADTMPDRQDTDGDGMWDGFEFLYMNSVNKLSPIECGHGDEDPDADGLSNYDEFLGPDHAANTNDWTNPNDGDTDGDGMPDGWETTYGLDPDDPSDAVEDPDGDGLTNLFEYYYGTNPWLEDTDSDGLSDGNEGYFGSNPLVRDTDGDGLLDGQEVWDRNLDGHYDGGFFPFWAGLDSDGDGFIDGPTDWDTDGDGMPDGFEVLDAFGNIRDPSLSLDPSDPNDGDEDYDGDGLSNLEEYLVRDALHGHPPVQFDGAYYYVTWDYSTDPFEADSDGDGMPDGWEVEYGLHPMDPIPCGTNCYYTRYPDLATDGDVDHDGLFNRREFSVRFHNNPDAESNSVAGASSNPWDPDSDRDGLKDGEEDRAFRSNPVLEDTDGDRLKDGPGPTWWGEVQGVTAITSHYDEALNDLWRLVWPRTNGLPHWEQVITDSTNVPPPRWGAASTYVPVYEAISPCCQPYNLLLDNRQFIVFGGRNGVNRYTDIWEYVVASNVWARSRSNMGDFGLSHGLSEFSAVTLLGYCNNGCDSIYNYVCLATPYGALVKRPAGATGIYEDDMYQKSSFDWTCILGGWDEAYDYQFPEPMESYYFKAQDRGPPRATNLTMYSSVLDVTRYSTGGTGRLVADSMYGVEPFGQQTSYAQDDVTNVYDGLNALHYVGGSLFYEASACATYKAELVFTYSQPPISDMTYKVFAEFDSNGTSYPWYTNSIRDRLSINGWFYNGSPITFTVPQGSLSYTVDVTSIMSELIAHPSWDVFTVGLIIDSRDNLLPTGANPSNNVSLVDNSSLVVLNIRWNYVTDSFWRKGLTPQPVGEMPSRRKSLGMVYDYNEDMIVAFGGMDGYQVFNDTYEGRPYWYCGIRQGCFDRIDICDPCVVYWERRTNTVSTPPARWGHSMAYDPAYSRVLMFGGFDSEHRPLNDLWMYQTGRWTEVKGFVDSQRPQPRGGASMAFLGGFYYDRLINDYCVGNNTNHMNKLILFGGTDGRAYFDDMWIFEENYTAETVPVSGRRWLLASPVGEMSQSNGPCPRAFASMAYAQNGRYAPDISGYLGTFIGDSLACDPVRCAQPTILLFGGRTGCLPTSRDTDHDLVDDGTEYELGGTSAGRDPRFNALIRTNGLETVPFAIKRIGAVATNRVRAAVATFESLSYPSYDERLFAMQHGFPFEGHPSEGLLTNGLFGYGVDAGFANEKTNLWFHRKAPTSVGADVWELGVPDRSLIGDAAAPRYAYSGRWCYGTDLNGRYVADAIMELYSPVFDLKLPSTTSTSTNFNHFYLIFQEWLDLKDSNDVVRVEVIRPKTGADIVNRVPGQGTEPIRIVPERNNAFNTTGAWRRVVVSLDDAVNETNLYLVFTLDSDASGNAGGWYIDDVAIVQGGYLSGIFTNMGSIEVSLLGEYYNGHVQASTLSDSNGFFQFDLLPFGRYQVGAVSTLFGPYIIGPTNAAKYMGPTNLPLFAISGIVYGMPTQITWPAVPGVTYEVQYSYDLINWYWLATVSAATTSETYLDYSGDPLRFYRVLYMGSP